MGSTAGHRLPRNHLILLSSLVLAFAFFHGDLTWATSAPGAAPAAPTLAPKFAEIGITEKLGNSVSIQQLTFKNELGQSVTLSDYFKRGKPVVLSLVYYECPGLCTFVLSGMLNTLKKMDWTPGNQFEVVSVSIDPKEGPALAAQKKETYLSSYKKPGAAQGWHFLTGEENAIKKLASEVGFGYRYDEKEKQYAHGAALFVLTPEGKLSRYLYGIEYSPRDLRLALLEASSGRIGSVIDRILLFCYRYDPQTRKYSIYLTQLMQAGCAGMTLILGSYLLIFWRRQRRGEKSALKAGLTSLEGRQGG